MMRTPLKIILLGLPGSGKSTVGKSVARKLNAAVGAFRVIAEIGGLLRAPIKPPEAKN